MGGGASAEYPELAVHPDRVASEGGHGRLDLMFTENIDDIMQPLKMRLSLHRVQMKLGKFSNTDILDSSSLSKATGDW